MTNVSDIVLDATFCSIDVPVVESGLCLVHESIDAGEDITHDEVDRRLIRARLCLTCLSDVLARSAASHGSGSAPLNS